MNEKQPDWQTSDPMNELEGHLRRAVQMICDRPMPRESLERALQRAEEAQQVGHKRRQRLRATLAIVAAAAVVLAAAGVWLTRPSVGWAQVAKALSSKPWIHATWKDRLGQQEEVWFSPKRGVSARRQGNWVMYDDDRLGIRYTYEPKEQTLYRVPHDSDLAKREVNSFAQVFESLLHGEAKLNSPIYGAEIVQQERRRVVIQNENWTEFELILRNPVNDKLLQLQFHIPPGSGLPRSLQWTPLGDKKDEGMEWFFEYPEDGPVDVYSLGVPRNSKVVDRVPPEDLGRLLKGAQVSRERFGPYHAIAITTVGSYPPWKTITGIHLVWRKGNRWRIEMARPTAATGKVEPPAPGADPLAWWKQRLLNFDLVPVSACNGKAVYRVDFSPPDAAGKQQRTWKELWKVNPDQDAAGSVAQAGSLLPDLFAYPPLPIPSQQYEGSLERFPKEGPTDSVLVIAQLRHAEETANIYHQCRYWIDPLRSYATVKYELGDLRGPQANDAGAMKKETYLMERLEQTPSGVWYPTVVSRKDCIKPEGEDLVTRFYMDFKADMPDSVFEPRDRAR